MAEQSPPQRCLVIGPDDRERIADTVDMINRTLEMGGAVMIEFFGPKVTASQAAELLSTTPEVFRKVAGQRGLNAEGTPRRWMTADVLDLSFDIALYRKQALDEMVELTKELYFDDGDTP